jgi:hypothetical protein
MIIDSNTLGWLIATGVAVYLIFKNWKRFIKLAIFALAAMFVLFVVQIKQIFDSVVNTKPKPKDKTENHITYDVKAELDSTNTVHIREVKVRN